jgi:hypothetical protein
MSRNIIFVLMYHHQKLLESKFRPYKHFTCLEKVLMLCDNAFAQLTSKSSFTVCSVFYICGSKWSQEIKTRYISNRWDKIDHSLHTFPSRCLAKIREDTHMDSKVVSKLHFFRILFLFWNKEVCKITLLSVYPNCFVFYAVRVVWMERRRLVLLEWMYEGWSLHRDHQWSIMLLVLYFLAYFPETE